ncbi:MAG: hypothetical protein GY895_02350 [Phycisphaera sp.]|nr:hypothetical protein [Phycisphaera sp.]
MTVATRGSDTISRPSTVIRTTSTIGWGFYCAASWTWCIGMFLPLILLSRFGWPGFWTFLIPNVVGCVAFGYVFDRESSRRFATNHALAIRWFGAATIAFQIFFLGWSAGAYIYAPDASASGNAAVSGAVADLLTWPVLGTILTWTAGAVALAGRGDLFWRWFATAVIATGIAFLGIAISRTSGPPAANGTETGMSLLAAAPIVVLGFLANPALDATFHRARQQTPSRHAFAVFGIAFTAMIVFAAWVFDRSSPDRIAAVLLPLVVAQWTVQLVFTIGAHVREVGLLPGSRLGPAMLILLAVLVGGVAGLPWLAGESTYLAFLGLYAIPFPMYVVASAVAGRRPLAPGSGILVMATSMLASPLAWFGFVDNRTMLLLPAVGITVIVGWVIGRRSRALPPPEADSRAGSSATA